MGSCMGKDKEKRRILMLGLDGSGKTTLFYGLTKPKEDIKTIPTIGFNIESMSYGNYTLNLWDVGGAHRLRDLWKHYYPGTHAVIWVIDGNDEERMDVAKSELHTLLKDNQMGDTIFAIACNQKNEIRTLHDEEIGDRLELFKYKQCGIDFFKQIHNTLLDTYSIPDEILGVIAGYLPRLRDGKQFSQTIELFDCNVLEREGTMEIVEWITNTFANAQ